MARTDSRWRKLRHLKAREWYIARAETITRWQSLVTVACSHGGEQTTGSLESQEPIPMLVDINLFPQRSRSSLEVVGLLIWNCSGNISCWCWKDCADIVGEQSQPGAHREKTSEALNPCTNPSPSLCFSRFTLGDLEKVGHSVMRLKMMSSPQDKSISRSVRLKEFLF